MNGKLILLVIILMLSSCSKGAKKEKIQPVYPITIAHVEVRNEPIFINLIGNVFAAETVQIRPQVGGMIKEIYIEGSNVSKGDILYKIDPRPYEAALEKAEAVLAKDKTALEFAEIRIKRYADLVEKDYFSKLNFEQYKIDADALRAQLLIDEADIAVAKINLEWTLVRSPLDGRSGVKKVDLGNIVTANDTNSITDIQQINPIDIYFHVTQKDWVAVQASENKALRFEVFLPQEKEKIREGKVYFIDNHVDINTGTVLMKGSVNNEDAFFWPGEFVQVRLELRVEKDAMVIPIKAIQVSQDGPFVFIYDEKNERVEYRSIVKGTTVGDYAIVKKGISPTEIVVTQGQINLKSGAKVTVANENGLKAL